MTGAELGCYIYALHGLSSPGYNRTHLPRVHENHPDLRLPRRATACTKGATSGPAASRSRCLTARSWRSRPTQGITGYGEVCPLGPFYLPAYAKGVRAGIAELGPHLLGEDPHRDRQAQPPDGRRPPRPPVRQVGASTSPAGTFWARSTGQPVCVLLGGPLRRRFRALSGDLARIARRPWRASVAGYRAEGYRRFQLKVGGDPAVDIERIRAVAAELQPGDRLIADANTGWLMHDALRVVRAVRDIDVYIEQPCRTYDECLTIRRHCDHPFVLDEVIDSIDPLLRGHADRAMDVVNIKISKFGGLTRAGRPATSASRSASP